MYTCMVDKRSEIIRTPKENILSRDVFAYLGNNVIIVSV